jgi:hypothetical protein
VADVAVCHSTLYVVPDLAPFAEALTSHAHRRVVLAIPDRHWLSWQDDLWVHFHGITGEPANTAASAEAVLIELGIPAHREQETVALRYDSATRADAVAEVHRRLCQRPEQDAALQEAVSCPRRACGYAARPCQRGE